MDLKQYKKDLRYMVLRLVVSCCVALQSIESHSDTGDDIHNKPSDPLPISIVKLSSYLFH